MIIRRLHEMKRQNGASMLEVLVTLVIVSFGLLGIAGIILNSLKSSHSSYARSQATLLANDMIERMRANRIAAEAAGLPYNLALNANPTTAVPSAPTVPEADLIDWRNTLANTLPSGTGSVNLNAATRLVTVVVQWNDSRVEGGSANQQISIQSQL